MIDDESKWKKARRLRSSDIVREITVIAMQEAVINKQIPVEGIDWLAQRIDELLEALISGKGLERQENGTYSIIERPLGFDPESNPEVLVIKPKG